MDPEHRIAVVIYPGFDELDALAPYEVISMAAVEGRLDVRLVALEELVELTAIHGTVVRPQALLSATDWDIVIVPGGGWAQRRGAFAEAERGELPRALATVHAAGVRVASVCTGAMLLAAAGLTDGRPATTHPVAIDALRESGAQIVDARVVDDGDVITAGPITSGLDLALWLVEGTSGETLAAKVAGRMGYRRRDDVYLGPRAAAGIRTAPSKAGPDA